ncbi:MAG: hypothetical protein IJX55_06565 [Clostridia bacterium]|nr:hypothetical protein [Clostridia bacterium]
MSNIKNNIDIAEESDEISEIDGLKKEIEFREADYLAMDSEKARKEDTKATYNRYMRQAEGNNPIWTAIAAGLLVVMVAVLGYAILESVNGKMASAMWVVIAVICAVCVLGIATIAVRDLTKRNAEAKMRLSSHIHRYNMQVNHRKIELDELKAKLSELENKAKK